MSPESEKITILIEPSNNIFKELGNNTYDYKDLLSELIDNSIAAKFADRKVTVTINIFVNENQEPIEFEIRDDASGIATEKLGDAITPAGMIASNSLNEHGLGMKQAIAALGDLKYLRTKTKDDTKTKQVKEFKFGELDVDLIEDIDESGTIIAIINLKHILISNSASITRSVLPYLGARYRRFLKTDNKLLDLEMKIIDKDSKKILLSYDIEEVKPIYFNPSTRTNKPVFENYKLKGSNWKAKLTFGYAPRDDEYEELGMQIVKNYHPYNVSLSKQGLDIILHNRVILFHQLSELDITPYRHNSFNFFRGEIILEKGFSTAITKNSMIYDKHFKECITEISDILNGNKSGPKNQIRDYLKTKTYPDQLPERLLRDRLANWLKNNPLNKKQNVDTEYSVQGVDGYIDILADNEAWELKVNQADALSVYQLFMYMDIGQISKGYLVANSFSPGAQVAVRFIKDNHSKEIMMSTLDQFPINHPPNEQERKDYF